MGRTPVILCVALAAAAWAVAPAPTVTIAKGVELPYVALGTGSGQHGSVANATALWLEKSAGEAIDTSIIYRDQREIAAGLEAAGKARGDYFLETKIVTADSRFVNYSSVGAEVDACLEELGVAFVDLVLIPFPSTKRANAEAWAALEAALAAGKTRAIGVSNFGVEDLVALKAGATVWPPAVNQLELSVSYHDDALLAHNAQEGIVVQAYSPLCGGFNGSSCTSHGGKNVLTVPEVKALAAKYDVSAAQIGLKWIVQQGYPLATSIWNVAYMDEDLSLWNFTIADADMATLAAVYKPK